jgi:hypothetical protein
MALYLRRLSYSYLRYENQKSQKALMVCFKEQEQYLSGKTEKKSVQNDWLSQEPKPQFQIMK